MMGSRLVMAVLGRPFLMASSTCFHCASRGPAMVFEVNMFITRKATTRSVLFISCSVSSRFSVPLDGKGWFVLRERHWPAPLSGSLSFRPLPRVAHHLANETDVAAQAVELVGKRGGHFHTVDGFLDLIQPLEQLLPLPGVRLSEQLPLQR